MPDQEFAHALHGHVAQLDTFPRHEHLDVRRVRDVVGAVGGMHEVVARHEEHRDRAPAHEVAREALDAGIELIGAVGEFASAFGRIAPGDPRVITADDAVALWDSLASRLTPDAIILLKGSRGMRLERLVEPITTWATHQQSS